MEHKVSKANSFKIIEDTRKSPIHFKPFKNWSKPGKQTNDFFQDLWQLDQGKDSKLVTQPLNDALSFISDKKPAIEGEKDS